MFATSKLAGKRTPYCYCVRDAWPPLRRMYDLEDRSLGMVEIADFRNDPEWLRLPLRRRTLSLARLQAIQNYKTRGVATVESAKMAADEAGISLRLFYQLLATWDAAQTSDIWTLVPYAPRKTPSKPKLGLEVETALHRLIRAAIAEGYTTPRAVAEWVIQSWPQNELALPSQQTIRQHAESAGGLEIIERGKFKLNTGPHPQEEAETATTHGEVLVIDHSGLEMFLDHPHRPRRATVTLAIDLHTNTVCGFAISDGPPSPLSIIGALDDAEHGSRSNPGKVLTPRLVFAATNGQLWRELTDEIAARGLQAKVRWSPRLHSGGPTKRLIGSRIADLPLSPRKPHDRTAGVNAFNPAKHALVTRQQARLIVEDAVRHMNSERIGPDFVLNRLKMHR